MIETIAKMAMMAGKVEVSSLGVDAYSAIFRGHPKMERGMEIVKSLGELVKERDLKQRRYHNHGYDGFINDFFFYGVKGNAVMIGAVGAAAAVVEEKSRAFFPEVTRIDIQITVQFPFPEETLIEDTFREQKRIGTIKKRWPTRKYVSSPTGDTLYVGTRGAGVMLRMYDKGHEYLIDPGFLIRYEVEYRDEKAENVAYGLARVSDQKQLIANQVFNQFYQVAIRLPMEYGGAPDVQNVPPANMGHLAYLDWARRILGPTMKKLKGFDEGQELLRELGIQSSFFDLPDNRDEGTIT